MRTSTLLAIVVVWCMPGSVNAVFTDNFESYTAGTNLVGQGGWQSMFNDGGVRFDATVGTGIGLNGSQGINDASPSTLSGGGAARGITSDIVGTQHIISLDVISTGAGNSNATLNVGESASVLAANPNFNEIILFVNGAGTALDLTNDNGARTSINVEGDGTVDWATVGWVRMEIALDTSGAGSAVGSVYDIDDTTGDIVSTLYSNSFGGNMPAFEAAGFVLTSNFALSGDNFISGVVPEPGTLALLALGGGLALLGRRRPVRVVNE